MNARDQNGNRVIQLVRREIAGPNKGLWGSNVWFGFNPATDLRRYYYRTQQEARDANIADENVVAYGAYITGFDE